MNSAFRFYFLVLGTSENPKIKETQKKVEKKQLKPNTKHQTKIKRTSVLQKEQIFLHYRKLLTAPSHPTTHTPPHNTEPPNHPTTQHPTQQQTQHPTHRHPTNHPPRRRGGATAREEERRTTAEGRSLANSRPGRAEVANPLPKGRKGRTPNRRGV